MNARRVAVDNVAIWRWQALTWAMAQQSHESGFVAFLNNNDLVYPNDPFPNRLFVGAKRVISLPVDSPSGTDVLQTLYETHRQKPSFLVGYLSYDVKNQYENLRSRNPDRLGFPDAFFAEPEWIIEFGSDTVTVTGDGDPQTIVEAIQSVSATSATPSEPPASLTNGRDRDGSRVQCRVSPDEYQNNVRRIQQHIRDGDVYELNYCIEFFAENRLLDPLTTYQALNRRSPMPFSAFLKVGHRYVMGASPERFIRKAGRRLISQPIKGTIRRGQTPDEDAVLRELLFHSEKERAENLMIVDLVRNDLARSAETGSVQVDELFGIYGFRQVYQMISTVSATLRSDVSWADAIRHAFPMGSMTGAPKIRAMQLIDELEVSRRGVYSGAIGYITPSGDFDFNVVIRTLLYDSLRQYASFSVGSAITHDADPAQEWEECLLKARAIRDILEQ